MLQKSHILHASFLITIIQSQVGIGLASKDEIKILGVVFRSNLKWDSHMQSTLPDSYYAYSMLYVYKITKGICLSRMASRSN